MAVSSLVGGGIYQKLKRDVASAKAKVRHHNALWVREQLQPNKPFTFDHGIPAFILLALGITSSILSFSVEVLKHQLREKSTDEDCGLNTSHQDNGFTSPKGIVEDAESHSYHT